jgi:hypothetical protein
MQFLVPNAEDDAMLTLVDPTLADGDEVPALPLPPVVDTQAVVLAGLLAGGTRPLLLDAAVVREIRPAAAAMLLALLRAKRTARVDARIVAAPPALRRRWAGRPLAAFFIADPDGVVTYGAEALFVCPDREGLGFAPSER